MTPDEARRIAARMKKAQRRLASGIDRRMERGGEVSERAILERLQRRLEQKP